MMDKMTFVILELGPKGILIQVQKEPSTSLLEWLLVKKVELSIKLEAQVIHTYNELLVKFEKELHHHEKCNAYEIIQKVLDREWSTKEPSDTGKVHVIPVCYEGKYAPDMEVYINTLGLSRDEVIALHTQNMYTVYFLGFLPGFPYLLGLDRRLSIPRKDVPTRKVPAGGVAIGGNQTGVYPQESPGGWYVIGQTYITLFNVASQNPSPFKAGDKIRFVNTRLSQFESMM